MIMEVGGWGIMEDKFIGGEKVKDLRVLFI